MNTFGEHKKWMLFPLFCGFIIVLSAPGAWAQGSNPLAKARSLASRGQVDAAIEELSDIAEDSEVPAAQRLEALETIGTLQFRRAQRQKARAAFGKLLSSDPGYQLKRGRHDQNLSNFFNLFKQRFRAEEETELAVRAPPSLPEKGMVQIRSRISGPTAGVERVVVYIRASSSSRRPFRPLPMTGNVWRFTVDVPVPGAGLALEYYVEVIAVSGHILSFLGSAQAPLRIQPFSEEGEETQHTEETQAQHTEDPHEESSDQEDVDLTELGDDDEHDDVESEIEHDQENNRNGRRFYQRWWFWTIVGVAVAGGTATAVGLTVSGDDGGGTMGSMQLP